jgi:hypothetical protein
MRAHAVHVTCRYGVGCRGNPCGPAESRRLRENPLILRSRAAASLDVLGDQAFVDSNALGANGYCFGGTVVLEMARAGLPVMGVASFHGGLLPLTGDTVIPRNIAVQVHTGDLDPITANELPSLESEVRAAGLERWGAYNYGNCAHGWTDPNSGSYRQREGTEAHDSMFVFYSQVFKGPAVADANATRSSSNATKKLSEGHNTSLEHIVRTSPLAMAQAELAAARREIAALRAAVSLRGEGRDH